MKSLNRKFLLAINSLVIIINILCFLYILFYIGILLFFDPIKDFTYIDEIIFATLFITFIIHSLLIFNYRGMFHCLIIISIIFTSIYFVIYKLNINKSNSYNTFHEYEIDVLEKFFLKNEKQYNYIANDIDLKNLECINNSSNDKGYRKILKKINALSICKSDKHTSIETDLDGGWSDTVYYFYYIPDTYFIKENKFYKKINQNWYLFNGPFEKTL